MGCKLSIFLVLMCLSGCARDTEEVLGTVSDTFTGTARNIAEQGPNSDQQQGADATPPARPTP